MTVKTKLYHSRMTSATFVSLCAFFIVFQFSTTRALCLFKSGTEGNNGQLYCVNNYFFVSRTCEDGEFFIISLCQLDRLN